MDKFFCESDPFLPNPAPSAILPRVTHERTKVVDILECWGIKIGSKVAVGPHRVTEKFMVLADGTARLFVYVSKETTTSQVYRCVCRDDEFCGEEFETTLRSPTDTTCCPSCGRQQEPKILRDL